MRKLCTILAILLVLCSAGCEAKTQPNIEGNNPPTQTPTQSNSSALAMVAHPSIRSFSEYEQFVASYYAEDPEFIAYETIKELGSFVKFTYYFYIDGEYYELNEKAEYAKTNKCYRYLLKNSHGKRLRFSVERSSGIKDTNVSAFPSSVKSTQNLCRLEDANGLYRSNNIYFYYYNGILTQISWIEGEKLIKIQSFENDMLQTAEGDNGFLTRLLSLETAEAAVAEFNAKVIQAKQEAQAEKAD